MIGVRSGIDEYGQPSEFVVSGYVGEFKYFGFETVPPHCLACDGSEVSRETYSELFAVFGTMYGAGNGTTTFNLPDLRGAFLRCIGGNAAGLGIKQSDATAANGLYIALQRAISEGSTTIPLVNTGNNVMPFNANGQGFDYKNVTSNGSINPAIMNSSDIETRPMNYAVNICVVYE